MAKYYLGFNPLGGDEFYVLHSEGIDLSALVSSYVRIEAFDEGEDMWQVRSDATKTSIMVFEKSDGGTVRVTVFTGGSEDGRFPLRQILDFIREWLGTDRLILVYKG